MTDEDNEAFKTFYLVYIYLYNRDKESAKKFYEAIIYIEQKFIELLEIESIYKGLCK